MQIDKEASTLTALSVAVEFGVTLIQEVSGQDLGKSVLNEQGREGIAHALLATIQRNVAK